jgi:hypothetical protein
LRTLDDNTPRARAGSRKGDTITVWCWYNGQLTYSDPLPVGSWALSYDVSRQIQTLDIEVEDTDGTKAPWLLDDPLGVGGSLLQVFYNVGGASSVAYDWFRISKPEPKEAWRSYLVTNLGVVNRDSPIPNGKSLKWVSSGAKIPVKAETLPRNIANYRFLAPTSPASGSPTVVSEVKRLLTDIMPVTTAAGVVDTSVPANLVYPDDRLNAVQDLCKRIGCDYRTTGAGQLEIYPIAYSSPVWTLSPGPEGFLIDVNRSMELDGKYNVFVVDGTANSQQPVRGIAQITGGPLRVGGPHGTYPVFYSSNLIATQAQADAYAQTMRDTQLKGLTTELEVECLPHPGLQQGDWITIQCPTTTATGLVSFPARITKLSLNGHDGTVDAMTLGLTASYSDVATVFSGVARG